MARAIRVVLVVALLGSVWLTGIAPAQALSPGSRVAWAGGSWYLQGANYPWHGYGTDFGSNAWGSTGVHASASYAAID